MQPSGGWPKAKAISNAQIARPVSCGCCTTAWQSINSIDERGRTRHAQTPRDVIFMIRQRYSTDHFFTGDKSKPHSLPGSCLRANHEGGGLWPANKILIFLHFPLLAQKSDFSAKAGVLLLNVLMRSRHQIVMLMDPLVQRRKANTQI
jgi:hypothetical protein